MVLTNGNPTDNTYRDCICLFSFLITYITLHGFPPFYNILRYYIDGTELLDYVKLIRENQDWYYVYVRNVEKMDMTHLWLYRKKIS